MEVDTDVVVWIDPDWNGLSPNTIQEMNGQMQRCLSRIDFPPRHYIVSGTTAFVEWQALTHVRSCINKSRSTKVKL